VRPVLRGFSFRRGGSGHAVPLADRSDGVHTVAIVPLIVVVAALPLKGAVLVAIAAARAFHALGLARVRLSRRPVAVFERATDDERISKSSALR